jgi:hypothetical protein
MKWGRVTSFSSYPTNHDTRISLFSFFHYTTQKEQLRSCLCWLRAPVTESPSSFTDYSHMDKVCLDTVKVRAVSYGNGTYCLIPIKLARMWALVKMLFTTLHGDPSNAGAWKIPKKPNFFYFLLKIFIYLVITHCNFKSCLKKN